MPRHWATSVTSPPSIMPAARSALSFPHPQVGYPCTERPVSTPSDEHRHPLGGARHAWRRPRVPAPAAFPVPYSEPSETPISTHTNPPHHNPEEQPHGDGQDLLGGGSPHPEGRPPTVDPRRRHDAGGAPPGPPPGGAPQEPHPHAPSGPQQGAPGPHPGSPPAGPSGPHPAQGGPPPAGPSGPHPA